MNPLDKAPFAIAEYYAAPADPSLPVVTEDGFISQDGERTIRVIDGKGLKIVGSRKLLDLDEQLQTTLTDERLVLVCRKYSKPSGFLIGPAPVVLAGYAAKKAAASFRGRKRALVGAIPLVSITEISPGRGSLAFRSMGNLHYRLRLSGTDDPVALAQELLDACSTAHLAHPEHPDPAALRDLATDYRFSARGDVYRVPGAFDVSASAPSARAAEPGSSHSPNGELRIAVGRLSDPDFRIDTFGLEAYDKGVRVIQPADDVMTQYVSIVLQSGATGEALSQSPTRLYGNGIAVVSGERTVCVITEGQIGERLASEGEIALTSIEHADVEVVRSNTRQRKIRGPRLPTDTVLEGSFPTPFRLRMAYRGGHPTNDQDGWGHLSGKERQNLEYDRNASISKSISEIVIRAHMAGASAGEQTRLEGILASGLRQEDGRSMGVRFIS